MGTNIIEPQAAWFAGYFERQVATLNNPTPPSIAIRYTSNNPKYRGEYVRFVCPADGPFFGMPA